MKRQSEGKSGIETAKQGRASRWHSDEEQGSDMALQSKEKHSADMAMHGRAMHWVFRIAPDYPHNPVNQQQGREPC